VQQEIEEKPSSHRPAAADGGDLRKSSRRPRVERSGADRDLAKNIGKRVGALEGTLSEQAVARCRAHGFLVLGQLSRCSTPTHRDLPSALAV